MYCTSWCVDCHRAKRFLKDRGVEFVEVNIDEDVDAEDLVFQVNEGRRKVPTIKVGDRYFACSPFDPHLLSSELNIPLNK
ncbi:MAG TPA: glutaredoxin family protein [Verrucomicrobiae bacterium]|nr:glutaredoxin family protein [Verrucomicrobiae bacterium]